jgi:hypothetical protein
VKAVEFRIQPLDAPASSSSTLGTAKKSPSTAGALASACSRGSDSRTMSSSRRLVIGSGWAIGSTPPTSSLLNVAM